MKDFELQPKHYYIGGAVLLLVVLLIFLWGKSAGRKQRKEVPVDVKVNIQDENGNTVEYDPTPLVRRLNEGLTTTCWWNCTERCLALEDLNDLDAVRFMAAVKAYRAKYQTSLETHIEGTFVTCGYVKGRTLKQHIVARIDALGELIE